MTSPSQVPTASAVGLPDPPRAMVWARTNVARVARSGQDRNRSRAAIQDRDILRAVEIEVPEGHGDGRRPHRDVDGLGEGRGSVAEQGRDSASRGIGDQQIHLEVGVPIPREHRRGLAGRLADPRHGHRRSRKRRRLSAVTGHGQQQSRGQDQTSHCTVTVVVTAPLAPASVVTAMDRLMRASRPPLGRV